MKASKSFIRLMKRVGVVGQAGRIYNHDLDTYTLGFTEVNSMAITNFGRNVVHKGWFDGATDIEVGARIQDRGDKKRYLVMSQKHEFFRGTPAYIDATLYAVNRELQVQRLDETSRNAFGRVVEPAFKDVLTGVWAAVVPVNDAEIEQPDRVHHRSTFKLVTQADVDIKENDRIITGPDEVFQVTSSSTTEFTFLRSIYVETDKR